MPSIHQDREPTYEPVVEVAQPVTLGVEDEPVPVPAAEPAARPRRRARGPRRPTASAHAGHAGGTGEASGA